MRRLYVDSKKNCSDNSYKTKRMLLRDNRSLMNLRDKGNSLSKLSKKDLENYRSSKNKRNWRDRDLRS